MTTDVHSQPSPALIALIAKSAADAGYRKVMVDDPERAVREAGVTLTDDEMKAIVGSTREEREAMMEALGERASQLSVTWFQQITTFFHFECFFTY
jgi:hypothetical protein